MIGDRCGGPANHGPCRLTAGWDWTDTCTGTCRWHTPKPTVADLVLDVLGTYRGEWMTVPQIQQVAKRARPSVNADSVRVEAFSVIKAWSSVERRIVRGIRLEHTGRVVPEELVELRVR